MKELQIDDSNFMTTQSDCKSENINVQAAFLHVLGDFIQSIGVIFAAIVMKIYVSDQKPQSSVSFQRNFFAASSKNRRSIDHVFFFDHCDMHDH